tara:strand:+ start:3494 stop:5413 length:1920 start_codon:yes stop_codon:yes gene_type:complete
MNIIDLQESLKDYPDNRLMAEYQRPTNNIPQFLILGELQRRKRMRDEYKRQEATNEPTVAEEMIASVGVPQEGLTTLASALTPNTALTQDTGIDQVMPMQATRAPQPMSNGGILDLLKNATGRFKGNRTKEDLYRQVEPFPENGTAAERRNWTLTYGMTHDADGMPKRMLPDVATTDVSPTVDYRSPFFNPDAAEVSTDLDDFMPKVADDTIIPRTQTSPISPSSVVGDLPFLPPPTEPAETESERLLREDVGDFNRTRNVLTEPEPSMSELIRQAQIERGGYEAEAKIETESAPDRSIDRQINPEKYMDLDDFLAQDSMRDRSSDRGSSLKYPTFLPYPTASGSFGNDAELAMGYGLEDSRRGRNRPRTERTSDILDSFYPELPIPASDVEAPTSAAEALQDQEDKTAPKADEDRRNDPLAFIDSVTDGGEDGAGFGSVESEIAKMISDRRKRAEQNKWLALAEAGFVMMGPAATLGEGISKGGRAGLKALRDSQKGMDAFESDMLKLQTSLDIAQQRSADTRYGADTRAATARYSADQARKSSEASTKARLESVEQRKRAEVADNIANMIAIIDSDIDRLGIAPGAAAKDIDPSKLDAYDRLMEERNKQLAKLKAITGTAIEDAGSSELFGKFNVTS